MRLLFLALVVALVPGRASAEYEFEFAINGTATTSASVNQGATVNVQVYLVQTSGTGITQYGLQTGGVAVNNTGAAGVATASGATPNTGAGGFDAGSTTGQGQANINVSQVFSPSVAASTTPFTNGAVLLGSFSFTGVGAGSTTFTTLLPNTDPPFANNTLGNNTNIDTLIANSSIVITVAAVPEPGSLILTGLAMSAAGLAAWRRKRKGRVGVEPAAAS